MTNKHKKHLSVLRARLLGMAHGDPEWYKTLEILNFVQNTHTGMRKDGITPEFNHQTTIVLLALGMVPFLMHPKRVINCILLHDTSEDYDISFSEIGKLFGSQTATDVRTLTKKFRGEQLDDDVYYANVADCPVASVVKHLDRIHNLTSMSGVFNIEKQIQYINHTEQFFFANGEILQKKVPTTRFGL